MTQIDFVYFDLDDTLLDHGHAEKEALRELVLERAAWFGHASFEFVLGRYTEINPVVWHKYSLGEFTKIQAKVGRFEQLLEACNPDAVSFAAELADEYLDRYSKYWIAIDGALEAFEKTAQRLPVGILTNGFSEIQRAKLKRFPQIPAVSKSVVISEEVGYLKPHPVLFQHAAEQAGVSPSSILYVGDSLRSDVEGGTGAGWKVAWYSSKQSDHPDVWTFTDWTKFSLTLNGGL
jgi:HAD superfamily hydrolase (TIGR01549 family)